MKNQLKNSPGRPNFLKDPYRILMTFEKSQVQEIKKEFPEITISEYMRKSADFSLKNSKFSDLLKEKDKIYRDLKEKEKENFQLKKKIITQKRIAQPNDEFLESTKNFFMTREKNQGYKLNGSENRKFLKSTISEWNKFFNSPEEIILALERMH